MKYKKPILAFLIAGIVLLVEFKFLPFFIPLIKNKFWEKNKLSPFMETETFKFQLISAIKESGGEVYWGPFLKEEVNGLETKLKINGYLLRVIFSTQQEAKSQLASLQLILKESKIGDKLKQGNLPILIDLTGEKPYVSF